MARRVENQLLLHESYRTCNGDLLDIFKKKNAMQGKCNERKNPPPITFKKEQTNKQKSKNKTKQIPGLDF